MKGIITIKLDDGRNFSGNVVFTSSEEVAAASEQANTIVEHLSEKSLDFSLPLRPFMNQYADKLSGSKKFALLIAHFAKGELDVPVNRAEATEAWNKMTGLLGGKFNGAHESRAKDAGYIYVPQQGELALLKGWRQVMQ